MNVPENYMIDVNASRAEIYGKKIILSDVDKTLLEKRVGLRFCFKTHFGYQYGSITLRRKI